MTLNELKELIEIVSAKGFAEFEVERSGFKLRIVASHAPVVIRPDAMSAPTLVPVLAPPVEVQVRPPLTQTEAPPSFDAVEPAATAPQPTDDDVKVVRSPIVGTFYRAPGPTSEPFVKTGDRVDVGSILCIVEAMKLMNEIESEFAGEIVKIFVENAQPVEYGQPLFGIRS